MAKLWEKKSWQSAPMLVLLLALFLTPSQVFSQVVNPNLCPIPQFNSYLMAFVSTETSTVDAYSFYDNGSARVPLAGEPIYVIKRNPNDNSITSICKDKSDAQGKISTTFDPNAANCTQFTFLHCIDSTSDWLLRDCISNESVRRIDPSYVVQISNPPYALFQRIPSCSGAAYTLPLPKNYSSAVAETQYCNPNKASAKEALCWPILLIFGLLVGAMFAIGRNPLHSFDLSAPRFDRGRQYQMRNMNVSFQVTPILGIAFEAAGLQTSDGKGDKKTDKMEDAGFSVGNVFSGIGTRLLNAVMANTLGIKPEKREDVKDENGNVVGTKDKKGNVFGLDGKQVGTVDKKGDVKNLKGELVGGLGTANIFSGAGAFKGKSFADAVSETSQSRVAGVAGVNMSVLGNLPQRRKGGKGEFSADDSDIGSRHKGGVHQGVDGRPSITPVGLAKPNISVSGIQTTSGSGITGLKGNQQQSGVIPNPTKTTTGATGVQLVNTPMKSVIMTLFNFFAILLPNALGIKVGDAATVQEAEDHFNRMAGDENRIFSFGDFLRRMATTFVASSDIGFNFLKSYAIGFIAGTGFMDMDEAQNYKHAQIVSADDEKKEKAKQLVLSGLDAQIGAEKDAEKKAQLVELKEMVGAAFAQGDMQKAFGLLVSSGQGDLVSKAGEVGGFVLLTVNAVKNDEVLRQFGQDTESKNNYLRLLDSGNVEGAQKFISGYRTASGESIDTKGLFASQVFGTDAAKTFIDANKLFLYIADKQSFRLFRDFVREAPDAVKDIKKEYLKSVSLESLGPEQKKQVLEIAMQLSDQAHLNAVSRLVDAVGPDNEKLAKLVSDLQESLRTATGAQERNKAIQEFSQNVLDATKGDGKALSKAKAILEGLEAIESQRTAIGNGSLADANKLVLSSLDVLSDRNRLEKSSSAADFRFGLAALNTVVKLSELGNIPNKKIEELAAAQAATISQMLDLNTARQNYYDITGGATADYAESNLWKKMMHGEEALRQIKAAGDFENKVRSVSAALQITDAQAIACLNGDLTSLDKGQKKQFADMKISLTEEERKVSAGVTTIFATADSFRGTAAAQSTQLIEGYKKVDGLFGQLILETNNLNSIKKQLEASPDDAALMKKSQEAAAKVNAIQDSIIQSGMLVSEAKPDVQAQTTKLRELSLQYNQAQENGDRETRDKIKVQMDAIIGNLKGQKDVLFGDLNAASTSVQKELVREYQFLGNATSGASDTEILRRYSPTSLAFVVSSLSDTKAQADESVKSAVKAATNTSASLALNQLAFELCSDESREQRDAMRKSYEEMVEKAKKDAADKKQEAREAILESASTKAIETTIKEQRSAIEKEYQEKTDSKKQSYEEFLTEAGYKGAELKSRLEQRYAKIEADMEAEKNLALAKFDINASVFAAEARLDGQKSVYLGRVKSLEADLQLTKQQLSSQEIAAEGIEQTKPSKFGKMPEALDKLNYLQAKVQTLEESIKLARENYNAANATFHEIALSEISSNTAVYLNAGRALSASFALSTQAQTLPILGQYQTQATYHTVSRILEDPLTSEQKTSLLAPIAGSSAAVLSAAANLYANYGGIHSQASKEAEFGEKYEKLATLLHQTFSTYQTGISKVSDSLYNAESQPLQAIGQLEAQLSKTQFMLSSKLANIEQQQQELQAQQPQRPGKTAQLDYASSKAFEEVQKLQGEAAKIQDALEIQKSQAAANISSLAKHADVEVLELISNSINIQTSHLIRTYQNSKREVEVNPDADYYTQSKSELDRLTAQISAIENTASKNQRLLWDKQDRLYSMPEPEQSQGLAQKGTSYNTREVLEAEISTIQAQIDESTSQLAELRLKQATLKYSIPEQKPAGDSDFLYTALSQQETYLDKYVHGSDIIKPAQYSDSQEAQLQSYSMHFNTIALDQNQRQQINSTFGLVAQQIAPLVTTPDGQLGISEDARRQIESMVNSGQLEIVVSATRSFEGLPGTPQFDAKADKNIGLANASAAQVASESYIEIASQITGQAPDEAQRKMFVSNPSSFDGVQTPDPTIALAIQLSHLGIIKVEQTDKEDYTNTATAFKPTISQIVADGYIGIKFDGSVVRIKPTENPTDQQLNEAYSARFKSLGGMTAQQLVDYSNGTAQAPGNEIYYIEKSSKQMKTVEPGALTEEQAKQILKSSTVITGLDKENEIEKELKQYRQVGMDVHVKEKDQETVDNQEWLYAASLALQNRTEALNMMYKTASEIEAGYLYDSSVKEAVLGINKNIVSKIPEADKYFNPKSESSILGMQYKPDSGPEAQSLINTAGSLRAEHAQMQGDIQQADMLYTLQAPKSPAQRFLDLDRKLVTTVGEGLGYALLPVTAPTFAAVGMNQPMHSRKDTFFDTVSGRLDDQMTYGRVYSNEQEYYTSLDIGRTTTGQHLQKLQDDYKSQEEQKRRQEEQKRRKSQGAN